MNLKIDNLLLRAIKRLADNINRRLIELAEYPSDVTYDNAVQALQKASDLIDELAPDDE